MRKMMNLTQKNINDVNSVMPAPLISASTAAKIEAIVRPSTVSHLYYTHFEPLLRDALNSISTELNRIYNYSRFNYELADKNKMLDTVKMRALYNELLAINEVVIKKCPRFHSKRYHSFHVDVSHVFECFLGGGFNNKEIGDEINLNFSDSIQALNHHISQVLSSLNGGGASSGQSSLAEELIATAHMVFCTTCSAGSGVLRHFKDIDFLIVDEAAQLFEPELFVPLQRGPRNLVMIGDPRQLPATIFSTQIQSARLGISAMQRLMDVCDYPFDLLNTQYRMHPAISSLSNKYFYAGQLFDSHFVQTRDCIIQQHWVMNKCPKMALRPMPKWLNSRFSFIDVSGAERGVAHMSNSMENIEEALMVSKIVSFLSNSVGMRVGKSVCVITFYAAQVTCIQKCLRQQQQVLAEKRVSGGVGGYCGDVKVLTVDSFQGSEADCVIVSFVRSNNDSRVGFVKDFQRLNVALTRARHLLLAVGNRKTLENIRQPHQQSVKSSGDLVDSSAPAALHHPLRGLILEALSNDCLFTAKDIMLTLS
mmetsp:Transcript_808/g.1380  ORF Transcript_808/g.1380 Transcript_808/m.1380 type:complete len:536 (+) Transcript_808:115-1722(+)